MKLLLLSVSGFRSGNIYRTKSYPQTLLQRLTNTHPTYAATNRISNKYVSNTTAPDNKKLNEDSLAVIYRFPHIVLVRAITRVKLFQTAVAACGIPTAAILSNMEIVEPEVFHLVAGVGLFACGMLFVMSELTRRAIGAMYIDPKKRFVKISHLTFWGKRKDILVPVEDIIPLADASETPTNIYVKLKRYSSNEVLYFSIKYGRIFDKEAFEFVFGKLDLMEAK